VAEHHEPGEGPVQEGRAEDLPRPLRTLLSELHDLRARSERDRGLVDALLEQTTHGVITCDPAGHLTLNRAAERIWGGPGPAVSGVAEWGRYHAFHPDGRPFAPEDWSMARALRSGEPVAPEYVTLERFDGTRAIILAGAAPIRGRDGELQGAIGVFADVTELKRAEETALALERRSAERARRLLEVTAALSNALTRDDVAAAVVDGGRAAVDAFDGSLWLLDDARRELRPVHAAPYSAAFVTRVGAIPVDLPAGTMPAADVVTRGDPIWISSRAELAAAYPGLDETEPYRALRDFAFACLPMTVEGRCIGVLAFSFGAARRFEEGERGFLLVLARHSAQALERARLYEAERRARAEAEAANARSAFLSEASALLASSLDHEATLASVARLAVPRIADWCAVDLADEFWRGAPSAIVAHSDPEQVERARELQRRLPVDLGARHWVPEVLRTGRPELYPELGEEALAALADSPERLAAVRELRVRSAMVVPMRARGRILGAITFVSARPGRHGPADLQMAEHLARRAGLAIDNALLYRQAQEAVRAREEVLAFVSHDLKNPLSAVRMSAVLLERAGVDRAQGRYVSTIRRSAERMDRLIHDLLDLSSLEAGRFRVERRPVDAPSLLADAAAFAQPLGVEKGVRVEVEVEPGTPPALADRDRVLQVLSNLVGNAIAFTPAGGRVTLRCSGRAGAVLFAVADTGQGIAEADRPRVFDRFWKSHDSRQGSGLGLAIARGIVEAHGGRIWFESRPGGGTIFHFELAAASPARAHAGGGAPP
jgi:PAS domain S-box-containing protein